MPKASNSATFSAACLSNAATAASVSVALLVAEAAPTASKLASSFLLAVSSHA